jgi:hypothetical protein
MKMQVVTCPDMLGYMSLPDSLHEWHIPAIPGIKFLHYVHEVCSLVLMNIDMVAENGPTSCGHFHFAHICMGSALQFRYGRDWFQGFPELILIICCSFLAISIWVNKWSSRKVFQCRISFSDSCLMFSISHWPWCSFNADIILLLTSYGSSNVQCEDNNESAYVNM